MKHDIHIKPSEKGSLHKALGIKPNALIPESTLRKKLAGHPTEKMREKLQFAENARHWNHG